MNFNMLLVANQIIVLIQSTNQPSEADLRGMTILLGVIFGAIIGAIFGAIIGAIIGSSFDGNRGLWSGSEGGGKVGASLMPTIWIISIFLGYDNIETIGFIIWLLLVSTSAYLSTSIEQKKAKNWLNAQSEAALFWESYNSTDADEVKMTKMLNDKNLVGNGTYTDGDPEQPKMKNLRIYLDGSGITKETLIEIYGKPIFEKKVDTDFCSMMLMYNRAAILFNLKDEFIGMVFYSG